MIGAEDLPHSVTALVHRLTEHDVLTSRTRVCLTAAAKERLGGPVWYSYTQADRLVGTRYPLYREPPRHSVEVTGARA